MSPRRSAEWKVYVKLKRKFLKENAWCQRCVKNGIPKLGFGEYYRMHLATQVHHWAGRRSNFLKVETWRASCDACNLWAKNHPKEAREEGWIAPVGVYLT